MRAYIHAYIHTSIHPVLHMVPPPTHTPHPWPRLWPQVAPICVYTSGKGSSAAGLTAAVVQDASSREFFLEVRRGEQAEGRGGGEG